MKYVTELSGWGTKSQQMGLQVPPGFYTEVS